MIFSLVEEGMEYKYWTSVWGSLGKAMEEMFDILGYECDVNYNVQKLKRCGTNLMA